MPSYGFVRVAAASPIVKLSNPMANAREMREIEIEAYRQGAQLLVFPELSIVGYTCRDLLLQTWLQKQSVEAIGWLAHQTRDDKIVFIVGAPLVIDDKLFNCAVAMCQGRILAVVPKSYRPGYKEFEEARWFAAARQLRSTTMKLAGQTVPVGTDLLIDVANVPGFRIGIEICEDNWMPNPPSSSQAMQGATILTNLSASNEVIGKLAYRRKLIEVQSGRCIAGYIYASCGAGESTTDVVFGGHCVIAENSNIIAESERFQLKAQLIINDIDVEHLVRERIVTGSFGEAAADDQKTFRTVACQVQPLDVTQRLIRSIDPNPFVPSDPSVRDAVCEEILSTQTAGLARRLAHVNGSNGKREVSLGISGGLDSTLALLATVRTYELLGWDKKGIIAVTMPGFGTSKRTKKNAIELCQALGVDLRDIPISDIVRQHLRNIGHDPVCEDCLQCNNAQARERTQILMDLGFVIGTGDLTEIALGWSTFNGDQNSMYNVNCSIPKTLIRYLIGWVADNSEPSVAAILRDIIDTPISPELGKLGDEGEIIEKSEDILGPYPIHDFILTPFVRHGDEPAKVLFLLKHAWGDKYSEAELRGWVEKFYQMFFTGQFKRDGAPAGPKVGSISLSQRGDWRMPADARTGPWLSKIE